MSFSEFTISMPTALIPLSGLSQSGRIRNTYPPLRENTEPVRYGAYFTVKLFLLPVWVGLKRKFSENLRESGVIVVISNWIISLKSLLHEINNPISRIEVVSLLLYIITLGSSDLQPHGSMSAQMLTEPPEHPVSIATKDKKAATDINLVICDNIWMKV